MSENNFGHNDQNPNGFPPNYSYSWNGSNNGGKKGGYKKVLAIIGIALGGVALVAGVVCAALFGDFSFELPTITDNSQNQSEGGFGDVYDTSEYSREEYSAPEFSFAPDSGADLSTELTDIYEKCAPSCCTVNVKYKGRGYAIGSGFVIDSENGYIATNHHVIEDGVEITVKFYNGQEFKATVVGSDATTDLAVLHVDVKNLPQLAIGDSSKLKIGQQVVAIGTPYDEGLAGTMTTGIVSGIARDIEITNDAGKVVKTMTLIQTDCAINPGNSGGPLIDMAGNVIGINSLKIASEEYENIGFAIPITSAVEVFKKLIAGEIIDGSDIAVASPQIGITVYDVKDGLEYFGMNPKCEYPLGVLVADIDINSAAYRAGLSTYDIITEFAGKKVTDRETLSSALAERRAGETVTVKVFRFNRTLSEGEYKTIAFRLDAAK
jgi:serine protease Do